MIKLLLYIISLFTTIWAMNSINFNNVFKKNKYLESRIIYIIICMGLAYLVTNFLYDFIELSKII
jgi:uncharacterized membrane protein YwzB